MVLTIMKHIALQTTLSIFLIVCGFHSGISAQTQAVIRIEKVWGYDLTMRLDTLTGQTSDSLHYIRNTFRIVTDSAYSWSFFPAECKGMLVFTDAVGNVQNFAVKSYQYEYFNGNINRAGANNQRELGSITNLIARHKVGAFITITSVELVDLTGKPMKVKVPPFRIVKTR